MRFYRESLTVSFMKILTDEAVNVWKSNIHACIFNSCGLFMQLCALHLKRKTNPYLLELLAVVLDPENKFNTYNVLRVPEKFSLVVSAVPMQIISTASTSITTTTTLASISTDQNTSTAKVITTVSSPITTTATTAAIAVITTIATTTPSTVSEASTSPIQQQTSSLNSNAIANEQQEITPTITSPSVQPKNQTISWGILHENQIFAKTPAEPHNPRGWLVDLINRFGQFGGFDNILERFHETVNTLKEAQTLLAKLLCDTNNDSIDKKQQIDVAKKAAIEASNITLHLIFALVRPFGQCYELLTNYTIEKYFLPMWNIVLDLLNSLSDDELKREAKQEGRNDLINGIIKSARCLTSRLPNQEPLIKELEMFRLKMILRLLKISSFNGKMNALNEINKIIFAVSYYPHRSSQIPLCPPDEEIDGLSADKIAKWIKESDVLGIVLHDSLHQPQYVEKLEKILRFLIKERALTLNDLEAVWQAQVGKHEAIVKNVHDLLAKLAWDFNTEQLDYLFGCFQVR